MVSSPTLLLWPRNWLTFSLGLGRGAAGLNPQLSGNLPDLGILVAPGYFPFLTGKVAVARCEGVVPQVCVPGCGERSAWLSQWCGACGGRQEGGPGEG